MICTHGHHIVIFPYLSSLSCCLWFRFSSLHFFVVVFFVPFLVVSGKLKYHPSPIHRPDRDRKLSQPPFILLPSPLHPPISTHVSVVMGNSDKRTLMGKKICSAWASKVKPHHFILLFPPFMHCQTPHLIHGQIMSVFQMTAFRLLLFMYDTALLRNGLKCWPI